ncbi:hypothetical protein MLD38_035051 [Melastoma candidum]|uniref:Uncharacterized protein n=1 Tax=Melastoma candidum TaxID=119954 RepID=A0ACB9MDM2_9MYRT|nr:hypothetical protein MLD38_035051 [Melastoma candidum]
MTPSTKLGISAVLVVILVLLRGDSSAVARDLASNSFGGLWERTTVILYNHLGAAVTHHCRSKDNDLGIHVLQQGQSWNFSFSPDVFFKTLFYSSFQWDGQVRYFNVYQGSRDFGFKVVSWRLKPTGPCYILGQDENCFHWKSAPGIST